jgi:hypothetical protein
MEADISILLETGHFYFALTSRAQACRRKMRMSGLCKVEMSAFMDGRGPHGNGANHFEPTRTGPIESVARAERKHECTRSAAAFFSRLHLVQLPFRGVLATMCRRCEKLVHNARARPKLRIP